MIEVQLNSEKKISIKLDPKRFAQQNEVLMSRIEVLEKENADFTRLLMKEKQCNLKKSQFLSIASHDCRSPLTSIQLSASLIECYYTRLDKERLFSHLDQIKKAVNDLTGMLDKLTACSNPLNTD